MLERVARARWPEGGVWLAVHVHRRSITREFLTGAVRPLIDALERTGGLERYFFIRYGEGGPHVRLRLHGRREWIEDYARATLREWFTAHFERSTSAERPGEASGDHAPHDRVEFHAYVPETDRYGGPDRIRVAERQFEISSRMALELMASAESWSTDIALGCAARLHIALVHAFGMEPREATGFFHDFAAAWSRAWRDRTRSRDRLYARYAAQYEAQRAVLLRLLGPTWRSLRGDDPDVLPAWLAPWWRAHRTVASALRQPDRHGRRLTRPEIHRIVASYVHMTNNRLGIDNRDEALLAFLIGRTLRELGAETAAAQDLRLVEVDVRNPV